MVRGLTTVAALLLALPAAAAEPLQITTSELGDAYVGSSYRWQLSASGGTLAYSWSLLDPEPPPGLALAASGLLEGKPTAAGDFVVRVRVRSGADSATASLPLHVIDTADPLLILTEALPTAFEGKAYSAQLVASGGAPPYTWILGEGAPAWMEVSADVVSGIPPAVDAGDPTTFRIAVEDARHVRVEGELSIRVAEALDFRVTTSTLPDADVGRVYSAEIHAEGGVEPYTFTVEGLPAGLMLSQDGAMARLQGAPVESGLFPLEVRATDADLRFAARQLFLSCAAGSVDVLTDSLPSAEVGKAYAIRLQSRPDGASWALVSGELPPGLALSEDGVIQGKVTSEGAGLVFAFIARATLAGSSGVRALDIAVAPLPPPAGEEEPEGGGCASGGTGAAGPGFAALLALRRRRR